MAQWKGLPLGWRVGIMVALPVGAVIAAGTLGLLDLQAAWVAGEAGGAFSLSHQLWRVADLVGLGLVAALVPVYWLGRGLKAPSRAEGLLTGSDDRLSARHEAVDAGGAALVGVTDRLQVSLADVLAEVQGMAAEAAEARAGLDSVALRTGDLAEALAESDRRARDAIDRSAAAVAAAESAAGHLNGLNEAAGLVAESVRMINEITDQANLLALDATMAAGDSGDPGLADGLRDLARRGIQAVGDIGRQVESVQELSRTTTRAVRRIGFLMTEVNESTNAIATAIEAQNAASRAMAANLDQAAGGNEAVAATMNRLTGGCRDTAQAAHDVLQISRDLLDQVADLRREMQVLLDQVRAA